MKLDMIRVLFFCLYSIYHDIEFYIPVVYCLRDVINWMYLEILIWKVFHEAKAHALNEMKAHINKHIERDDDRIITICTLMC